MFGTFISEDTKVSMENYYNIDTISKQHVFRTSDLKNRRSRDLSHYNYSI